MKMIVWILEDEYYILNGIKTLLYKEFPNTQITTFQSALTAVDYLQIEVPDIVITDIVMGNYSGLDFIEKIRNSDYQSKVIIISGHEKFQFAQKALQLGVLDYLLKPINQQKLIHLVNKCISMIEDGNQQLEKTKSDEEQVNEMIKFGSNIPSDHFLALSPFINKLLENYSIAAVCNKESAQATKTRIDMIFKVLKGQYVSVKYGANNVIIITNIRIQIIDTALKCLAKTLKTECADNCFKVGYSSPQKGIIPFYHAVMCAIDNMSELTEANQNDTETLTRNIESEYYSIISRGNFSELPRVLSPLFESLINYKEPCIKPELIKKYYKKTYDLLVPYLSEELIAKSSLSGLSMEEISQQYLILFDALYNCPPLSTYSKKCLICDVVCEIVDDNLKDASLLLVADKINMNPTYISNIYKEINKTNFKQYITTSRINKAKELFMESDLTYEEIANEVGYSDLKYFKKIIKNNY